MSTDNITLGEIKELMTLLNKPSTEVAPWQVGKAYFIRTVTMHLLGKLERVGDKELVLSSASWIADSGRWHDAIKTGELEEVEPFVSDVIVGRGAVVDATEWTHDIPMEQK